MLEKTLFFSDNFFSAGKTDIYNDQKEKVGEIDLKSAFSSSIDVMDGEHRILASGKFPILSNKWKVRDEEGQGMGELKGKFSFLTKKFEYRTSAGEVYLIKGEAFSRKYEIYDSEDNQIAVFEKVSGFFASAAYRLHVVSDVLKAPELVTVVMGVMKYRNEEIKQQQPRQLNREMSKTISSQSDLYSGLRHL